MTYIEAINYGFPGVQCSAVGLGAVYGDIVWEAGAPLPTQEALDSWIAANPNYGDFGTKITVLALRNRFLPAEKVAIDLTSMDDATAPMEQRQLASSLRVTMVDIQAASYIDLANESVIGGIQTLEYFGLIAVGRADEILSTPVQEHERPEHPED